MFNASTVKVIFGGLSVDSDLDWLSKLTGRRYVLSHTRQTRPDWRTDYSSHWEEVPVLRADEIRTLNPGHALLMFSATAPIIADLPLIFDTRGGRQLLADMQHHGRPQRPGPNLNRPGMTEPSDYQAWASPSWSRPSPAPAPAGTPDDPDFDVGGTWPWDWSAMSRHQAQRMWDRLAGLRGLPQPPLRLGLPTADPHVLGLPRRPRGGAHHPVLVPVGGVQRARRQPRQSPSLAHLLPAPLLRPAGRLVRRPPTPEQMPGRQPRTGPPTRRTDRASRADGPNSPNSYVRTTRTSRPAETARLGTNRRTGHLPASGRRTATSGPAAPRLQRADAQVSDLERKLATRTHAEL